MKQYSDEVLAGLRSKGKFDGKLLPVPSEELDESEKIQFALSAIQRRLDEANRALVDLPKIETVKRIKELIDEIITDTKIDSRERQTELSKQLSAIRELLNKPSPPSQWILTVRRNSKGFIESVTANKQ
jgi:hypothetical protein